MSNELGGAVLEPDAFDGSLVQFEGGFAMDHHDDAKFFTAGWAYRPGEGFSPFQANKVVGKSADQAFDQPALAGFKITEQPGTATAVYLNYLSDSHAKPVRRTGGV